MDEHIYALEKLVEAIHELVTNAGRVQQRIFEAGLHLDRFSPATCRKVDCEICYSRSKMI